MNLLGSLIPGELIFIPLVDLYVVRDCTSLPPFFRNENVCGSGDPTVFANDDAVTDVWWCEKPLLVVIERADVDSYGRASSDAFETKA